MTTPPATAAFRAIGTTVTVAVGDPDVLAEATAIVQRHVEALDAAASRFREDSELAVLNRAGGRTLAVSPLLAETLGESLDAARRTGGLIDPTVGRALEVCGYDRDFRRVAADGPPVTAVLRNVPGWRRVDLDRAAGTARIPPGVTLDLGSTAKAGCADRAARAAAAATGAGVLANLGGDIAVAGTAPDGGWVVRVADRHDDAGPGGVTVAVTTGGIATSGTAARRWTRGGRTLHHLVDPATGAPADTCWRTVTVAAGTCLDANVASTAAVILGPRALAWLAKHGHHARLVAEDGTPVPVGDWPHDALEAGATPAPTAPRPGLPRHEA